MKLIIVCVLALICLSQAKFPKTHQEFFSTPSEKFTLGYYLDWGNGPFDPIVSTAGMSRVNDLDLLYYSFITLTYDVNIVWGGSGYANGSLVEGYFADNQCNMYAPGQGFQGSFCSQWQASGYCDASGLECPINNPQGGWCASERFNPIAAQSAQKQQPFGISIGGWSDTIDTPYTTEQATQLATNIVAFVNGINNACGGTTIIQAIDFDWEHLSDANATGTKEERMNAYATVITQVRQALPEMIMSYTTRFNAFLNFTQDGVAFDSNMEGTYVAAAFQSLGYNIADVFTFVNIMAYDTPPTVISADGWTIEAYTKILQSFDNRYGGIFAPSQIMMGIETGQQAAGGIYPGYDRTMCLINFINQEEYKGVMIWAPNQFTYRYVDTYHQGACNFTGTTYNQTAWEMGWPSGSDPQNPNCRFYPINSTLPQYNQPMADCIENIGPFMANQAKAVFNGDLTVSQSQCQAPSWNPCGMCPTGTVLQGTTCACQGQNEVFQNGQCVCQTGYVQSGNNCIQCASPQVVVNGQCQCPGQNQVFQNGQCVCQSGYQQSGSDCVQCASPQVIVNGQCQCPGQNQVFQNGQCVCPSGFQQSGSDCVQCASPQVVVNGQCQCPGQNQVFSNGQCVCQSGYQQSGSNCVQCASPQVIVNGQCQCPVSGQTFSNGQCACPTGQVLQNNSCVTPKPVTCPANSVQAPSNGCPAGQALSQYPGCCCTSDYYPDTAGNVCLVKKPTCNCTQWMITPAGQFYGIPLSWCYTDCYSPNSYPIGLHIACSRYTYNCDSNDTQCSLSNVLNTAHQFCGCTEQTGEIGDLGKCNTPPKQPSMFLRKSK